MQWLDRIQRRTRWFGVPNIALPIVMVQTLIWVLERTHPEIDEKILLQKSLVLSGEWWRVVTFLFVPTQQNPLFLFFALYLFYIMSAALENLWGAWRYNLYLFIGWLATVGFALIAPDGAVTNFFLYSSVFLAFAEMYPDFVLRLFLIFPVQVRYIAIVTWILLIVQFGGGNAVMRFTIAAGVLNFFLFFTRDLIQKGARRPTANEETD